MRLLHQLLVACLTVTSVLVGGSGTLWAQGETGVWSERAPLPLPRSETSTAQIGSRIFVMGGGDGHRTPDGKLYHGGHWRDEQEWPLARAEPTTFYALPEGQHGLFVGGGGSVRVPRLIGAHRMADMMLTGRVYSATEGAAYGFAQYLTEAGGAYPKAMELAERVAANAPLTNFAVLQALPMIAEANPQTGLLMESLMATVAQSDKEAKRRIRDFLDRKTAKVKPS